ncbi:MAG: hypothetical protein EP303_04700 [Deltaproteobacteria bacterium]|nr:MAG: hypothetical protein EP303_04700 [Deltaproteobacteria bacterium]
MHTLNQMDPNLYLEALRKQAQVWEDLITAFEDAWNRAFSPKWKVQVRITEEEVLADLGYGRD